jgi:cytochrome c553
MTRLCIDLQCRHGTHRTESLSMLKNLLLAIALAIVPALPALAWAQAAAPSGNAAAGANKTQMCAGCHGIPGWRTAYPEVYKVPKIGGQHAAYIVKALTEYKSGERTHPSMRAIAASLSEQDMADLAAYYSAGAAMTASK